MLTAMDGTILTRDLDILLMLASANSLPVAARLLLGKRLETPVDFNIKFPDGRPWFGPHKTWRGIAASVSGTMVLAVLLDFGARTGFWMAILSMAGDLLASFIKRRLGMKSGARATGLDQAVEAFLPLAVLKDGLGLAWLDCLAITVVFTVLEMLLSPLLYRMGLRRHPY